MGHNRRGYTEEVAVNHRDRATAPKGLAVMDGLERTILSESHSMQVADDKTIETMVKGTLDQIEKHIDNYYSDTSAPLAARQKAELESFDRSHLAATLSPLIARSRRSHSILKQALTKVITSNLSYISPKDATLLPLEFVLSPSTVNSTYLKPSKSSPWT